MKNLFLLALFAAAMPAHATNYITDYESVPAGSVAQVLGFNGAAGDILERLVINVTTSGATSEVSVIDGSSPIKNVILPANTPVGSYSIYVGARSRLGGWKVSAGAGSSVFAVGSFR